MRIEPLQLTAVLEHWPLTAPFRIAGHTWHSLEVVRVSLTHNGCIGEGEGEGVYYRHDTPSRMLEQIEANRSAIEAGLSRHSLQRILPAGGARNALDCAFWDLEAKITRQPAWQIAGLEPPRPLLTTFTCGADTPTKMAETAQRYTQARAIKVKLTGEAVDASRVQAVRDRRPDVWLGVDANQAFNRRTLDALLPILIDAKVELIEQPFPAGQEAMLDGLGSPIPIAADESAQTLQDIPDLVGRFDVVNIKLDKCGGLTEGLAMARAAREQGMRAMVGNMLGTSLAMAPAFLVGQLCRVVDLDGPIFLERDRPKCIRYLQGELHCPEGVWG